MLKSFSHLDRHSNISRLSDEEYDLAIIGGGINGAGIARDAASRGMKVLVLEADDFASGTSSRSSKLVHGGIRYLENLEFGLVFEALTERARLFDLAPHLVHPLRFVLPVYKGDRVGMNKLGAGMALYDLLSTYEAPELHERLGKDESLERLPLLNKHNLKGSFVYSDAYMDDDRLVIETLRAANQDGANIVNYMKVTEPIKEGDEVIGLKCMDQKTGKEHQVKARYFVGALGPWTDRFFNGFFSDWKKRLRPTKGIHITVSRDRVKMNEAVVMVSNDQKRIVFGIPRHEMTIFGTTDTDFREDPREVTATSDDVQYLLKLVNQYFPGADLNQEDIISSYAGVRPLVADGSESEGKTSREHEIWNLNSNFTVIAGGKYTTYRLIAEEVMDQVLGFFPLEDQVLFARSKSLKALNPLVTYDSMQKAYASIPRWSRNTSFSKDQLTKLVDRHGMEADNILSFMKSDEKACEELLWVLEARHAIRNTMCLSLRDFYFRRTPLFLSYPDHGHQFLEAVTDVFVEELGWDDSDVAQKQKELFEQEGFDLAWKKASEQSVVSADLT